MFKKVNRLSIPLVASLVALLVLGASNAKAAEKPPIRIGFGMGLSGGLAANGKAALLAFQLWQEDVNKKGGILGRKVELVYYDDRSDPSTVPGIYTKLLNVDKVDLVLSDYGTALVAPSMPILMQRGMVVMSLFSLALNEQFKYKNYFGIMPSGPQPALGFSKGFLDLAVAQTPKPQTIAIAYIDNEFGKAGAEGARGYSKKLGLKNVYDRSYPPATTDFTPILRAIQAANPDIVYVSSYPPDTLGIVRAANEVGLKTKMFGGAMVGLQYAVFKTQLGPLLNGMVDYDFYVPEPTLKFPGIKEFLARYQPLAKKAGTDPLGFYLPPYAYAEGEILAQAANAVGSLDQAKMGEYIRTHTFHTVVGDIKFAPNGEWAKSRVLFVQYQNVKGNGLDQFRKPGTQAILYPPEYKSGKLMYPYSEVKR